MSLTVWLSALGLYVLFRAWYDNWRGPIRASEIESLIAAAQNGPTAGANDMGIIRKFLAEDDGREFVMCNLVKVADGMIPHPTTGVPTPGRDLMQVYSKAFMPALFARGGHPAIVARAGATAEVLCTLKDAVKLVPLWPRAGAALWYVSQTVVVEQGAEILEQVVARVLAARRATTPTAG
mgnify:CR=1 FL=1